MSKFAPLNENDDYYLNSEGNKVFTESYLLKRGYCCQSGCLHCPYGYMDQVDPMVPPEFKDSWSANYEQEEEED